MAELKELGKPKRIPELKKFMEDFMNFIFTKSQKNLTINMPWGDNKYHSSRNPSIISDQSGILISGRPPHWVSDTRIMFEYVAPHSGFVETGTPPHPIGADKLVKWVARKIGKSGKEGLRIAFAIANKIKKEGMDPHPFVRPAVHEGGQKFNLKLMGSPDFEQTRS